MSKKGVVYYTDNRCEERILLVCRKLIKDVFEAPVCVSQFETGWGEEYVMGELPRASVSMFKQIYKGLTHCKADIVFLCEHDVLYHPSHFDYTPPTENEFWYNHNRWAVNTQDGHAIYRLTKCTSLVVAYRDLLLRHFESLLRVIGERGYSRLKMGFAPGTHKIEGVPRVRPNAFFSEWPCIDIRHDSNFTPNRFKIEEFKDLRAIREWKESDTVPGWGRTEGRGVFDQMLRDIYDGKIPKKEEENASESKKQEIREEGVGIDIQV